MKIGEGGNPKLFNKLLSIKVDKMPLYGVPIVNAGLFFVKGGNKDDKTYYFMLDKTEVDMWIKKIAISMVDPPLSIQQSKQVEEVKINISNIEIIKEDKEDGSELRKQSLSFGNRSTPKVKSFTNENTIGEKRISENNPKGLIIGKRDGKKRSITSLKIKSTQSTINNDENIKNLYTENERMNNTTSTNTFDELKDIYTSKNNVRNNQDDDDSHIDYNHLSSRFDVKEIERIMGQYLNDLEVLDNKKENSMDQISSFIDQLNLELGD